jgi:hypothetical protein
MDGQTHWLVLAADLLRRCDLQGGGGDFSEADQRTWYFVCSAVHRLLAVHLAHHIRNGDFNGHPHPTHPLAVVAGLCLTMVVAKLLPIDPGGLQAGFSILRYVSRDFLFKKSGPRTRWSPGPGLLSP